MKGKWSTIARYKVTPSLIGWAGTNLESEDSIINLMLVGNFSNDIVNNVCFRFVCARTSKPEWFSI